MDAFLFSRWVTARGVERANDEREENTMST